MANRYQPTTYRPAPAPVVEVAPMPPPQHAPPERQTFWKKLGGRSLTISLILHTLIIVLGVFWIFQVIPEKQADVDFMPKGGGGGQPAGAKNEKQQTRRASMSIPTAPRLAAKGATSTFTLPEPDPTASVHPIAAISSSMAGGLGGSGSGGGRGSGHGTGFGSGNGPGMGGNAPGMSPFGMLNNNPNALQGILYDTKQTNKRQPTSYNNEQYLGLVRDFVNHGWNERSLEKFYQAPNKLYLSRLYIPAMDANAAPKAFNCEKEVQPSHWLIVYRGMVTPPKTGRYRFVGCADDMITVRFNSRNVLDGGFCSAYLGKDIHGADAAVLTGRASNKDLEKEMRRFFKLPVTAYPYPTTTGYNSYMGGLLAGEEFEARQGTSYPIEIMISEVPGAVFGAALMIEEIGADYQKAATGSPILPLFRLDNSLPEPTSDTTYGAPYDPQGSVWKLVGGTVRSGI